MSKLHSAMARGFVVLPLLAGVVAAQPVLASQGHSAQKAKTYKVKEMPGASTSGFVFSPAKLTIHVGDKVTWVDANMIPHNVVGLGNTVIKKTAIDTKSYTLVFKKAGTYKYNCQIHPGMTGTIIVK